MKIISFNINGLRARLDHLQALILMCKWVFPQGESRKHEKLIDAGIDYELRGMEKPFNHALIWATYTE